MVTDSLLALVPVYGLWLIFGLVALSCLGLPVPSSVLVLTAGGFAAAGDLSLTQVIGVTIAGILVGDQIAYWVGRRAGGPLITRMRRRGRLDKAISRAEALLARLGAVAIFLSRTVFSPLGPTMTYVSAAIGMGWLRYTLPAALGGCCWSATYAGLGYGAIGQLSQYASLIWYALGALAAGAALLALVSALRRAWRKYQEELALSDQK